MYAALKLRVFYGTNKIYSDDILEEGHPRCPRTQSLHIFFIPNDDVGIQMLPLSESSKNTVSLRGLLLAPEQNQCLGLTAVSPTSF